MASINIVISLVALFIGFYGWFDDVLRGVISNEILLSISFLVALGIISSIIDIPFSYYSTFSNYNILGCLNYWFFSNLLNLKKVSPSITGYTIVGMLVGAVISVLVLIVLDLRDDTIRGEEYILQNYDYPILAKIPDLSNADSKSYGYYYGCLLWFGK